MSAEVGNAGGRRGPDPCSADQGWIDRLHADGHGASAAARSPSARRTPFRSRVPYLAAGRSIVEGCTLLRRKRRWVTGGRGLVTLAATISRYSSGRVGRGPLRSSGKVANSSRPQNTASWGARAGQFPDPMASPRNQRGEAPPGFNQV